MAIHDTQPDSRLFTLRIWTEPVGDGSQHRGSVRDVVSGAFLNFRDWSDLTAFLASRMEEEILDRRRAGLSTEAAPQSRDGRGER